MFKKEISFISDLNLNKLQVIGDKFTISDLKSSKIHPAILHYINASIDKEIFSDRQRIENNSIFDYKSDRINNYFILISEEVKRAQHFDLKYLKQTVQNAINFNINFLTNPNRTLIKFIFGDFEIRTIEEIVIGISHAYYYRYLQKILLTYLDKKKVLSLTKKEFEQLLERVDIISRETHLEDTLTTAVNSMTNFFDQNSRTSSKLPIKAIQVYLEEKNLTEFSTKIEKSFISDSSTLISGTDILNVLRSVTPEVDITLDETKKVEDEFIEDEQAEAEYISPDLRIDEENDSARDVKHFKREDIFEVSEDDEIDIPNHEILSTDEVIIDENNLDELEDENLVGQIRLEEDFEELTENDQNINDSEESNRSTENPKGDEPQKKKPDGIKLLNEIIDLSPLYNSLLSANKPFDNFESKINLFEAVSNPSEDLNYQIDITTLKEKLNVIASEKSKINKSFETTDIVKDDNENIENNVSTKPDILENDFIEFGDSIDSVVSDSNNEEFLDANENLEEIEISEEEENIIEDPGNTLLFPEEEMTEVFRDLTYLDSNEDHSEIKINEVPTIIDDEFLEDNTIREDNPLDEEYDSDYKNSSSFSDHLVSKDMSKIIELIFDYDMEEYYSIINNISACYNEEDGNNILENYCKANHIDLESTEVDTFKSIISEYFSKSYT